MWAEEDDRVLATAFDLIEEVSAKSRRRDEDEDDGVQMSG